MRRIVVLSVLAVIGWTGLVQAQDTSPPAEPEPQISVSNLLGIGFEVKAMSFVDGAIVVVLQRGTAAYVCETDQNGQSRLCVMLQ